ncbi:MAG: hypothetical protein L0229_16675 [Blastocatellia bacterium]|nr:hypothetical protein [Blastocatellia bacterium]
MKNWSAAMNQFAILFEGQIPMSGLEALLASRPLGLSARPYDAMIAARRCVLLRLNRRSSDYE